MQRRSHSTELKVKIAVEVLKGQKTMNELASVYSVHPNQISRWKQEALEILPADLAHKRGLFEAFLKVATIKKTPVLKREKTVPGSN